MNELTFKLYQIAWEKSLLENLPYIIIIIAILVYVFIRERKRDKQIQQILEELKKQNENKE